MVEFCTIQNIVSPYETEEDMDSNQLRKAALHYHRPASPGKIAVTPIKQLTNQ